MLGFEHTPTGYRATDEQVAWWQARDTCPAGGCVVSPATTVDGVHHYECDCAGRGDKIRWTRKA